MESQKNPLQTTDLLLYCCEKRFAKRFSAAEVDDGVNDQGHCKEAKHLGKYR